VTATGPRTEIGRIGKSLQALCPEPSPMQSQVRRMMWIFALLGILLCAAVVVLYGLTRGAWLDALLAGITLAISLLPQEFLVVLTVFLALGAWRISRSNVLTRRIPALETLGAATVLCVDKTGTITENRMTVTQLVTRDARYAVDYGQENSLPETFHELVEFSVLASMVDPFDPMEKAFRRLADHYLAGTEHLHDDWTLIQHYPLSRDMLARHVSRLAGHPPRRIRGGRQRGAGSHCRSVPPVRSGNRGHRRPRPSPGRRTGWLGRACASWPSPGRHSGARSCRRNSTISPSSFSA